MADDKKGKTYLLVTGDGDWQELGEAGDGATIWELPESASKHLNEDPGDLDDTLENHGKVIAEIYTEEGGLTIVGEDVDRYVDNWAASTRARPAL